MAFELRSSRRPIIEYSANAAASACSQADPAVGRDRSDYSIAWETLKPTSRGITGSDDASRPRKEAAANEP
jgi:hypothetical protein